MTEKPENHTHDADGNKPLWQTPVLQRLDSKTAELTAFNTGTDTFSYS
jgi:hypothetical protein